MRGFSLSEAEYLLSICEPPKHSVHEPTYFEAVKHAAGGLTYVEVEAGETIRDALERQMRSAVDCRNDYYRERMDDWRVVSG